MHSGGRASRRELHPAQHEISRRACRPRAVRACGQHPALSACARSACAPSASLCKVPPPARVGGSGDYTARSGYTRARQLLLPHCSEEEVERALASRVAFVNVWHPFGAQPVAADPLALAVWGSFGPADVMTHRLHFAHRVGEIYRARYSPSQRWVYFSGVSRHEAILIKVFDSRDDGVTARFSLHAAFRTREQEAAAQGAPLPPPPPRESIELRALVLYGEGLERLAPSFGNVSMAPHDATPKVKEQARLTELEVCLCVGATGGRRATAAMRRTRPSTRYSAPSLPNLHRCSLGQFPTRSSSRPMSGDPAANVSSHRSRPCG